MAKGNNRSLLLAGLAAGAYAYFSKPENREKALVAFNNTKTKVNSFIESQKHAQTNSTKQGHSDPHDVDDNTMVDEGAMTSVQYYNDEVQSKTKNKDLVNNNENEENTNTLNN